MTSSPRLLRFSIDEPIGPNFGVFSGGTTSTSPTSKTASYKNLNEVSYDNIPFDSVYKKDFKNIDDFSFDNLKVTLPKNYKPTSINFSLDSELKIITKLRSFKKKTKKVGPSALVYFFNTLEPKEEYKGSLYIDTSRNLIIHYVPDNFNNYIINELLRIFLLFISKKNLNSYFFRVYTEGSSKIQNIELTDASDETLTSAHLKNSISMINHSLRNKLGGNFESKGITNFFTDQQKDKYYFINRSPRRRVLVDGMFIDDDLDVFEGYPVSPGLGRLAGDLATTRFINNILGYPSPPRDERPPPPPRQNLFSPPPSPQAERPPPRQNLFPPPPPRQNLFPPPPPPSPRAERPPQAGQDPSVF